jgi:hypothetical protein
MSDQNAENGGAVVGQNAENGSAEVARVATGSITAAQTAAVERFREYIQGRAEIESQIVAKELAVTQMAAILQADTPDELDEAMKLLGVVGLRDFDNGTELQIEGFHVAPGTREEYRNSLGVFAVMQATLLESGQTVYIDTGIERVITYLRACEAMDRFPLQVRVVKQDTGRGNTMVTLLPIPRRVVTPA